MDYVTCVELFIDLKPQIGWISFWAKIRCSEVFEVTLVVLFYPDISKSKIIHFEA